MEGKAFLRGLCKAIGVISVIIVLLLTSAALADNERTSGLYTYTIKGNGTITIIDYDWDSNGGDVYIPAMIDGYTVTGIADGAFRMDFSSQDECVAYQKTNPKVSVMIPEMVTSIGDFAFMNANLSSVSIPSGLIRIGSGAFANCPISLFVVDPQNAVFASVDGALYNKTTKTLVAYPIAAKNRPAVPEGIVVIGDYALYQMGEVESIVQYLPKTVKTIGKYAFEGCIFRSDLILDVDIIDEGAFKECTLQSVNTSFSGDNSKPLSLTIAAQEIGDYAFYASSFGAAEIHCVTIGAHAFEEADRANDHSGASQSHNIKIHATIIGDYAFCNLHRAGDYIFIEDEVQSIGCSAFMIQDTNYVTGTQKGSIGGFFVNEPEIKFIGENAFLGVYCAPYRLLLRAYSGETIESGSFKGVGFTGVTGGPGVIVISGNIIRIEKEAFSQPQVSATEIELPEVLEFIGERAFYQHNKLTEINLPESLTYIGASAFGGCTSLTSIEIPAGVTFIGDDAFEKAYITLIVESGSYAEFWAKENGYSYKYKGEDTIDWLNN